MPPHAAARRRLNFLLALGVATAAGLAAAVATGPVTAEIRGHTVGYSVHLSHPAVLVAGYLLATVGSLLLSGDRWLLVLGVVVGVGAAACFTLWRLEFVSTWCAFAALWSVLLFDWVHAAAGRRAAAAEPDEELRRRPLNARPAAGTTAGPRRGLRR